MISIQVRATVTLIPVWEREMRQKEGNFKIYIFATVPLDHDFNCREARHVWGKFYEKLDLPAWGAT